MNILNTTAGALAAILKNLRSEGVLKFRSDGAGYSFSAANGDFATHVRCMTENGKAFIAYIEAKRITELLSEFKPTEPLQLIYEGGRMILSHVRGKARFSTAAPIKIVRENLKDISPKKRSHLVSQLERLEADRLSALNALAEVSIVPVKESATEKKAREKNIIIAKQKLEKATNIVEAFRDELKIFSRMAHSANENARFVIGRTVTDHRRRLAPVVVKGKKISIPNASKIMQNALRFVAVDNVKPALNGVLLKISGGVGVVAASDGYRLFEHKFAYEAENVSVIIPADAISRAVATLQESAEWQFTTSATHVVISDGVSAVTSRLIDNHYPNYEAILQREEICRVAVSTSRLRDTVSRVLKVADKESPQVRLSGGNSHALSVLAEDVNEGTSAEEIIPAAIESDTPEFSVQFNGKFIIQMLNVFSGVSTAEISLAADNKPTIITAENLPGTTVLIMPVRK